LRSYPRTLTLSSAQNVTLSPNNLKHNGEKTSVAWERFIEALQ